MQMTPYKPAWVEIFIIFVMVLTLRAWAQPVQAAVPGSARVETGQANQFIADLGAQAILVLRQTGQPVEHREAIIRDMLSQRFALEFIGRFALGRYWRTASAGQQKEYLSLFSEFVVETYSSMLGGYVDESFEVQGATQAGQYDTIVSSRITSGARDPMRVDWRLRMVDGQPQIIDVSVGGVSMSITKREEFAALVQRNGVQGLLDVMRARSRGLP